MQAINSSRQLPFRYLQWLYKLILINIIMQFDIHQFINYQQIIDIFSLLLLFYVQYSNSNIVLSPLCTIIFTCRIYYNYTINKFIMAPRDCQATQTRAAGAWWTTCYLYTAVLLSTQASQAAQASRDCTVVLSLYFNQQSGPRNFIVLSFYRLVYFEFQLQITILHERNAYLQLRGDAKRYIRNI